MLSEKRRLAYLEYLKNPPKTGCQCNCHIRFIEAALRGGYLISDCYCCLPSLGVTNAVHEVDKAARESGTKEPTRESSLQPTVPP